MKTINLIEKIEEYLDKNLNILYNVATELDDLCDYFGQWRIYEMDSDFDKVFGCAPPYDIAMAVNEGVNLSDNGKVNGGFDVHTRYFMIRQNVGEKSTFYWNGKPFSGTLASITNKYEEYLWSVLADDAFIGALKDNMDELSTVQNDAHLKTLLEELKELD